MKAETTMLNPTDMHIFRAEAAGAAPVQSRPESVVDGRSLGHHLSLAGRHAG